ncbi:MAG: hypothetical protein NVS3B21_07020 [Acidimicrobiales bacterium]
MDEASEVIEAELQEMLRNHPEALVAAVDVTGLFVAVPTSLVLNGQHVAHARSALNLVQHCDRDTVMRAWDTGKVEGRAHASVAVAGDDASRADLELFDVRPSQGVFVAVMISTRGALDHLAWVAEIPPAPPRYARTCKNEFAVLTAADDDVTAILGWPRDEFVGRRSVEFIHPDDQTGAVDLWMEVIAKPGASSRGRMRHLHKDGRWIWLEVTNVNHLDQPNGCIESEMFDISDEMDAHEAVRQSEQLLRRLAEALPVGVVQFDAQREITYANARLVEILGGGPDSSQEELFGCVVDPEHLDQAIQAALDGVDIDLDVHIDRLDNGGRRRCTLALRTLTTPAGQVTGLVGCLTDVTEARRLHVELEHRATYDSLTGCVNRASALEGLGAMLDADRALAVAFIDMDGFKAINDEYGHAVGDTYLVAVAARLREAVRAGEIVGRLGGDEFLVICPGLSDPADALAIGNRLAAAISAPLTVGPITLSPKASMGVAWIGADAHREDADALIAYADGAMYASKADGRGEPVLADAVGRHYVLPTTAAADLMPLIR